MPWAASIAAPTLGRGAPRDWRWTKTRLAPQDTHPRHDQVINRWLVLQRPLLAIGGDGAVDETSIERRQPVEGYDCLVARGGPKFSTNTSAARISRS